MIRKSYTSFEPNFDDEIMLKSFRCFRFNLGGCHGSLLSMRNLATLVTFEVFFCPKVSKHNCFYVSTSFKGLH